MDPLKLLSRSTKRSRATVSQHPRNTPSSGQNAPPQLFSAHNDDAATTARKRKRGQDVPENTADLDFFGTVEPSSHMHSNAQKVSGKIKEQNQGETADADSDHEQAQAVASAMTVADRKAVLRQHKLKFTWLNPSKPHKKDRRKAKDQESGNKKAEKVTLYPQPLQSFSDLPQRYNVVNKIASNIEDQGYAIPTEVQLGAIPLLLGASQDLFISGDASIPAPDSSNVDLLIVAPTGSGKTLAFAIPLLHRLLRAKKTSTSNVKTTSAIILAPTKELAAQIVNECRKLAHGTGLRVTQVRKGMKFADATLAAPTEHESDNGDDESEPANAVHVKADVIVSTPGLLASVLQDTKTSSQVFANVEHLVLDEADILLDQLFREQTLAIWNHLPHVNLRVSLWSATMGSNIEELACSIIDGRRARRQQAGSSQVAESPLIRLVVGLKDSAVPNVEHRMVYSASEQGKLMGLRNLLHPTSTTAETGTPLMPPFLVFTQTIQRAAALHSELLYDIPAEAGGIGRIAVLHSDLSDTARDGIMTKFRKGEIWVLITTDLLSRGVDFRGMNGVVNYDIPTSSAAYVHRVGRTGRAGREGGVAITLFSQEDIPYMKPIANLVAAAQKQRAGSVTAEVEHMQKWLAEALPNVSKKARQDLKKHGVLSRTARGMKNDPKSARRAKISTKSGYLRREENKRRGAIIGSRKRQEAAALSDTGNETDFGGFEV